MANIFQIVGVLCFLGGASNSPAQSVVWINRGEGKPVFVAASGWRDGKAVLQVFDQSKQAFPGKIPLDLSLVLVSAQGKPIPSLLQAGVVAGKLRIASESGVFLEEPMGEAEFGDPTCLLPELGGMAAHKNTLICTFPRRNALWFIDLTTKKITSKQALPDFPSPTGAAYDSQGRLWVLSGNSLAELQFTSDGHFNPVHHRGDFDHPRQLLITADGKFYVAEMGEQAAIKILNAKLEVEKSMPLPNKTEVCALAMDDRRQVWAATKDGKLISVNQ